MKRADPQPLPPDVRAAARAARRLEWTGLPVIGSVIGWVIAMMARASGQSRAMKAARFEDGAGAGPRRDRTRAGRRAATGALPIPSNPSRGIP